MENERKKKRNRRVYENTTLRRLETFESNKFRRNTYSTLLLGYTFNPKTCKTLFNVTFIMLHTRGVSMNTYNSHITFKYYTTIGVPSDGILIRERYV